MEITWQEGRLDDKHSGSHPEANVLALADKELHQGVDSHQVDLHPEVDLYPEANVLALADKELHPEVDSHPVDSHPEVNVLALVV